MAVLTDSLRIAGGKRFHPAGVGKHLKVEMQAIPLALGE
jgi:hypothetical protein